MRLAFWLVGVPLAVAVALFAVANRDDVTIEFLGYAAVLPKFMLILGAIFVGLLIGGTSAWNSSSVVRRLTAIWRSKRSRSIARKSSGSSIEALSTRISIGRHARTARARSPPA